jgi:hypothetical protein
LESGEQDAKTSYTDAIDEWISIDDIQKRKEETVERQGRANRETKQSIPLRQATSSDLSLGDRPDQRHSFRLFRLYRLFF